jgi:carboxyl-terminal processing protease
VFDTVWETVRRDYVDPEFGGVDWAEARRRYRPAALQAKDERELYRVLDAMVEQLHDQHAFVTGPTEVARIRRRDNPGAPVGLRYRYEHGGYAVAEVWPDGPAWRAGVEPDWTVESVDGVPFDPADALATGRRARFVFRDAGGAARALDLTPLGRVPPPAERFVARRADGVEVMGFKSFDEVSTRWVYDQVARLPAGARLVLDLRANRGGDAGWLGRVVGCFVRGRGPLARVTDRDGHTLEWPVVPGCPRRARLARLVVLVDRHTVSSGEIAAAVLKRQAAATIVGERTGGAVRAAKAVELPDGGVLALSRLEVRLTDGPRLEGAGVVPDVSAVTRFQDLRDGRDPALDKAAAVAVEN